MSQTCWALLLIVLGALFEIAGVVVVVDDVRKSKRAWRDYINRQPKVFGAGASELAVPLIDATGHTLGGREPTVEERVASLETQMQGVDDQITARVNTGMGQVYRRLAAASGVSQAVLENERAELAVLFEKAVIGNSRIRLIGAAAIFVGIIMQTVGAALSL